ncbi:hypothetical protein HOD29_06010 [archaeon]|jgi:hypothetical protein|nr:hypothetical protein [archaeon]
MEEKGYIWINASKRISGKEKEKINYFFHANFPPAPAYEGFLCHKKEKIGKRLYNAINKEERKQLRLISNTSLLDLEDLKVIKKKIKKKFKDNGLEIKVKLEKAL